MEHTLSVLVENRPGVMSRVVGLFSRRGFNIESLAVGPTEDLDVSRITLVVRGDRATVDQVRKQLDKLIDVLCVEELAPDFSVSRQLALIKVRVGARDRPAVLQMADVFRARVVDLGNDHLTLEITGDDSKVDALIGLMAEHGIIELCRTGRVALGRGADSLKPEQEADAWQRSITNAM